MKPIRCFSCGKVLGNKWEVIDFLLTKEKMSLRNIFEKIGISRYCCKKVIMTAIDCYELQQYPDNECQERNSYKLKSKSTDYINFIQSK